MRAMKIFCCQHDIAWENPAANHAKAKAILAAADIPRGSLVLLAEMFACGFSMNVPAIAERAGGATERFLADTARELGIYLMGGVVGQAPSGRGRNQAVVFSPAGVEHARYCKTQPLPPAARRRLTKQVPARWCSRGANVWSRRSFVTTCVSRKSSVPPDAPARG